MKSYIIEIYSDDREPSEYGAYSEMNEDELEEYILNSSLWRDLYDDYIDTWLANQDFEDEDEEEEWYDNITLRIIEFDNIDELTIIVDERKK